MGYFEIIWMLLSCRYAVIAFVSLISAFTTLWEKETGCLNLELTEEKLKFLDKAKELIYKELSDVDLILI